MTNTPKTKCQLAPLLMLSASFANRGKTERETVKVFGRKKGLESLAQVYR